MAQKAMRCRMIDCKTHYEGAQLLLVNYVSP